MRILLDAHTLIWFILGDPKLSPTALAWILDPVSDVCVSAATYREIGIKAGIGKLQLHRPLEDFLDLSEHLYRFATLPIETRHVKRVARLGYPTAHRDPFDRMLAAQSLTDGIPVVGNDTALDAYGVTRIW